MKALENFSSQTYCISYPITQNLLVVVKQICEDEEQGDRTNYPTWISYNSLIPVIGVSESGKLSVNIYQSTAH